MLSVRISRVRTNCEDIPLPRYATEHSAGMDLCAAIETDVHIDPHSIQLIPTSFAIELPPGFEAQVRPRSGLALKHGIAVLNSPGTIDADYRGEIGVILMNLGSAPFVIKRGDRIAQMVVGPYERISWNAVEDLSQTARGTGGFGHSGVSVAPPASSKEQSHE